MVASFLQVSVTFDPFSCLAVPLPKKMRLLSVVLMKKEPNVTPVKVVTLVTSVSNCYRCMLHAILYIKYVRMYIYVCIWVFVFKMHIFVLILTACKYAYVHTYICIPVPYPLYYSWDEIFTKLQYLVGSSFVNFMKIKS